MGLFELVGFFFF